MELTNDQIQHIAKLAKLKFSDAELDKFAKEFNSILEYVKKIQECDTTGIEFEHNLKDFVGEVLQADIVKPFKDSSKLLENATDGRRKGSFIKTSKIVNK